MHGHVGSRLSPVQAAPDAVPTPILDPTIRQQRHRIDSARLPPEPTGVEVHPQQLQAGPLLHDEAADAPTAAGPHAFEAGEPRDGAGPHRPRQLPQHPPRAGQHLHSCRRAHGEGPEASAVAAAGAVLRGAHVAPALPPVAVEVLQKQRLLPAHRRAQPRVPGPRPNGQHRVPLQEQRLGAGGTGRLAQTASSRGQGGQVARGQELQQCQQWWLRGVQQQDGRLRALPRVRLQERPPASHREAVRAARRPDSQERHLRHPCATKGSTVA
mmetsp:Transcript_34701/g.95947  ORF Transcript_34701/g.95947 Transcript_34701/m.95947 type:complete len:269 (+) Transcript_34701:271-1077(+)